MQISLTILLELIILALAIWRGELYLRLFLILQAIGDEKFQERKARVFAQVPGRKFYRKPSGNFPRPPWRRARAAVPFEIFAKPWSWNPSEEIRLHIPRGGEGC